LKSSHVEGISYEFNGHQFTYEPVLRRDGSLYYTGEVFKNKILFEFTDVRIRAGNALKRTILNKTAVGAAVL